MHLLVEHRIGAQRQLGHRAHAARGRRERITGVVAELLVEHLHERNTARLAAIDQRLHVAQEPRQLLVPKVGPPAEGFLHVDKDQSLLHGLRASVKQSATSCGTRDSSATATADAYRTKTDTSLGRLPWAAGLGLH